MNWRMLAQLMKSPTETSALNDENTGFLTAYYYDSLVIKQEKRNAFFSRSRDPEPELNGAQKAALEKLKTEAASLGVTEGLKTFIRERAGDKPPAKVAELFIPYRESIHLLQGDEFTDRFYIYLEQLSGYAVLGSMRLPHAYSYLDEALEVLDHIHYFSWHDLNIIQTLRNPDPKKLRTYGAVPLLVAEIELGNQEIIDFISATLTEGDNEARVSNELIEVVLRASNPTLHEQLGKLLLAARLQEGLREAILFTASRYSSQAFLYLLGVIAENGLMRFSSVKKAVNRWLGLGLETSSPERIYTKLFGLVSAYLADPDSRKQALDSADNLELLSALWAIAFYDGYDMVYKVRDILQSGDRQRIKTIAYYLSNSTYDSLIAESVKTVLALYPDDLEICAAFDGLFFRPQILRHGIEKYDEAFSIHEVGFGHYETLKLEDFFTDKAEALSFYHIYAGLAVSMGTESRVFEACGVPWYHVTMQRKHLLCKMLCILYLTQSKELTDDYLQYWDLMDPEGRANTLNLLLKETETELQWNTLISALADKAHFPRKAAFECLKNATLPEKDLLIIEGYLKLKAGDLRQNILALLIKQPTTRLLECLERLLTSPSPEMRQGGLSLALEIKQQEHLGEIHDKAEAIVAKLSGDGHTEKTLAQQVVAVKTDATPPTAVNAFGLATNLLRPVLPPLETDFQLTDAFPLPWEKMPTIISKLAELINENASFEYRNYKGDTVLIGNSSVSGIGVERLWQADNRGGVSSLPLEEIWRGFYNDYVKDHRVLFQLIFYWRTFRNFDDSLKITFFRSSLARIFGSAWSEAKPIALGFSSYGSIFNILNALETSFGMGKNWLVTAVGLCVYVWNNLTQEERWYVESPKHRRVSIFTYGYFETLLYVYLPLVPEDIFIIAFSLRYTIHLDCMDIPSDDNSRITMIDLARAVNLGIVPFDELILEMTSREGARHCLRRAFDELENTRKSSYLAKERETLERALNMVTEKLISMEIMRGDRDTEATPFLMSIKKVSGIPKLIALLAAIGDAAFVRSFTRNYYYMDEKITGRQEALCWLLKRSCPGENDTPEMLSAALKEVNISDKRLVELAMYNSTWMHFIGKYLGWEGFESGCWYFRAHMHEWFSKEEAAEIENYTPIPVSDMRDGAFDAKWFFQVKELLGDKRFAMLYEAAKYTTEGAKHARARLFADAVSGKLSIEATQEKVAAKRNKDLLLAFTLIPLCDKSDLLNRYLFLQEFAKESKHFGPQRRESEATAVNLGMSNLARTAGYSDVTRLIWAMETLTAEKMYPFFAPQQIEDVTLHLHINEDGDLSLVCIKAGKELKSVPSRLKKNETVAEMVKLRTTLGEQCKRARAMLEKAMIDEEAFLAAELRDLCGNPVIYPLIKNLVFRKGENLGYFRENCIWDVSGTFVTLHDDDALLIAHPLHLYRSGEWRAWQEDIFKRQVRQPFKQIFRELYLKLPEEMDTYVSRRYEGSQLQRQQAYALLQSRRWSEAGYDTIHKGFYTQKTFITLAIRGWEAQSIEPPTLQTVEFHAYDQNRRKPIVEISDLVFSEAMRDIDLVVSVAHAGRVDPQFSHSTIEMRSAIVTCVMEMLGIKNVRLEGSHAHIDGAVTRYNLHLGSGIVHQQGGTMISIRPIHAQQRGRVFLPFMDDDPKTAEILSKILLLAEDKKIKDPAILSQIHMMKT